MKAPKSILKAVLTLAVLGILICGLSYLWLRYSPRSAPSGQPPLAMLDASSLQSIRDSFNAHREEVRILAMLSPT